MNKMEYWLYRRVLYQASAANWQLWLQPNAFLGAYPAISSAPRFYNFSYVSYDFYLNSLEHNLQTRHIELEQWFSETIGSVDMPAPLLAFFASSWAAVKKQIAKLGNRIRSLRRNASIQSFKPDIRLTLRKKMNVVFKNLDDDHICH